MGKQWLSYSRQRHIDYCQWLDERARRAEREGRLESARTIRQTLSLEERRFRRPLARMLSGASDALELILRGLAFLRDGRGTWIER